MRVSGSWCALNEEPCSTDIANEIMLLEKNDITIAAEAHHEA